MKFGLFYEHQNPKPWDDGSEARVFAESLEQIEVADANVDYTFEYADQSDSTVYHEPYGIPFPELFDLTGQSLGQRDMRSLSTYLSF